MTYDPLSDKVTRYDITYGEVPSLPSGQPLPFWWNVGTDEERHNWLANAEIQERVVKEKEEKDARWALEVERLAELEAAQISPSDWHGYGSAEYKSPISSLQRFEHSDQYGHGATYYRPPTGWDYVTDTPERTYFSYFGENSLADIRQFEADFYEFTNSEMWQKFATEKDKKEAKEFYDAFLNGEKDPLSAKTFFRYSNFDMNNRKRTDDLLNYIGIDYTPLESGSLRDAKEYADEIYTATLQRALQESSLTPEDRKKVEQYLNEGPLDFDTKEDHELWIDLYNTDKDPTKQMESTADYVLFYALSAQASVMDDYLYRQDIDLTKRSEYTTPNSDTEVLMLSLNTGTASGIGDSLDFDNYNIGEFGSYSNYSYNDYDRSDLGQVFDVAMDVLSVVYPQSAYILQGAKTLSQTGDLEEAVKTGATTYVSTELGESILTDEMVVDGLNDLGFDISSLPVPVQNVIVDSSKALLEGDSATDAAIDSVASETWSAIKEGAPEFEDALKDFLPDVDFDTPEWIEKAGDVVVDTVEAVGTTVEPVIEAVGGAVEDVVIDPIDKALDTLGSEVVDPALQTAQQATEAVINPIDDAIDAFGENVVDPALQTAQQATEAVINPIDDAIDAFGENVVDPILEAGSNVLSDVEDVLKSGGRLLDDIIDWDSLIALKASGIAKPLTPTENLFAGEIYRHKIKDSPDMLFSNEQIKKYLKGNIGQQPKNIFGSLGQNLDMFGQPQGTPFGKTKETGLFGMSNNFLGTSPNLSSTSPLYLQKKEEEEEEKEENFSPLDLFSSTV